MVASGTDYDKDGIDDACDLEIGEPPTEPEPTPDPSPSPNPSPVPTPTPAPPTNPNPPMSPIDAIVTLVKNIISFIVNVISAILHKFRFGW